MCTPQFGAEKEAVRDEVTARRGFLTALQCTKTIRLSDNVHLIKSWKILTVLHCNYHYDILQCTITMMHCTVLNYNYNKAVIFLKGVLAVFISEF